MLPQKQKNVLFFYFFLPQSTCTYGGQLQLPKLITEIAFVGKISLNETRLVPFPSYIGIFGILSPTSNCKVLCTVTKQNKPRDTRHKTKHTIYSIQHNLKARPIYIGNSCLRAAASIANGTNLLRTCLS